MDAFYAYSYFPRSARKWVRGEQLSQCDKRQSSLHSAVSYHRTFRRALDDAAYNRAIDVTERKRSRNPDSHYRRAINRAMLRDLSISSGNALCSCRVRSAWSRQDLASIRVEESEDRMQIAKMWPIVLPLWRINCDSPRGVGVSAKSPRSRRRKWTEEVRRGRHWQRAP